MDLKTFIAEKFLPTPNASDAQAGSIITENDQVIHGKGLPRRVTKTGWNRSMGLGRLSQLLPSPQAADSKHRGNLNDRCIQNRIRKSKQIMLSMSFIATPTAQDGKGSGQNSTMRDRLDYQVEKTPDGERLNGQLNPRFVEQMMGFPPGWTDCTVLEIQ